VGAQPGLTPAHARGFIACEKLLGDGAGKVSVFASADPCHVTLVPLVPTGTKLTSARRLHAIAAAKRQARVRVHKAGADPAGSRLSLRWGH
jgi:hypothetical protein